MSRLFGTDGVRGLANAELTPELAFRIGRATAALFAQDDANQPIVVGRDTRLSGTMLEAALVAGITSTGRDTLSLGVLPTPGVARITVLSGATSYAAPNAASTTIVNPSSFAPSRTSVAK
jgi:phosphoglucosamine mutase